MISALIIFSFSFCLPIFLFLSLSLSPHISLCLFPYINLSCVCLTPCFLQSICKKHQSHIKQTSYTFNQAGPRRYEKLSRNRTRTWIKPIVMASPNINHNLLLCLASRLSFWLSVCMSVRLSVLNVCRYEYMLVCTPVSDVCIYHHACKSEISDFVKTYNMSDKSFFVDLFLNKMFPSVSSLCPLFKWDMIHLHNSQTRFSFTLTHTVVSTWLVRATLHFPTEYFIRHPAIRRQTTSPGLSIRMQSSRISEIIHKQDNIPFRPVSMTLAVPIF